MHTSFQISMYNRYHFILAGFTFFIILLFYKVIVFKVEQFRTDHFTETIIKKNQEIENRNTQKANLERYIHTNAYKTQVAKATQNKNLPGEEIINVISQEELDGNKNKETQEVLNEINRQKEDPTHKMSNPEKWQYLFQKWL